MFFLVFVLFSCTFSPQQNKDTNKPQPTIYTTPAGDKIIFLDDYYKSFLEAVRSSKNTDSLYRVIIQYPILNQYFSTCEYSEYAKYNFYYPIEDTTGLENYISGINRNRSKIERLIASALAMSNKYLKNDSINIYIIPSTNYLQKTIRRMGGIAGFTVGSKQILLTVDTEVNTWPEMLEDAVTHESNHAYWIKMNFKKMTSSYGRTLLDDIVFEGKADSYAHLFYPNIHCPWDSALSHEDEPTLWSKIKPELDNSDMSLYRKVMFGSAGDYPVWGGYKLGYKIVQAALKNHPELTPEEWTNLDSKKILEMSGYQ